MIRLPIPFRSGDQPVFDKDVENRIAYLRSRRKARDKEFKEFLKTVLKVKE